VAPVTLSSSEPGKLERENASVPVSERTARWRWHPARLLEKIEASMDVWARREKPLERKRESRNRCEVQNIVKRFSRRLVELVEEELSVKFTSSTTSTRAVAAP